MGRERGKWRNTGARDSTVASLSVVDMASALLLYSRKAALMYTHMREWLVQAVWR